MGTYENLCGKCGTNPATYICCEDNPCETYNQGYCHATNKCRMKCEDRTAAWIAGFFVLLFYCCCLCCCLCAPIICLCLVIILVVILIRATSSKQPTGGFVHGAPGGQAVAMTHVRAVAQPVTVQSTVVSAAPTVVATGAAV